MRIAIVGAAQTSHTKHDTGANFAEMVYEVVQRIFVQTRSGYDDLGCTISASSDFTDGRTISDMAIQDVVQAVNHPESKVSMDGAFAVAQAAMRILSGQFDTALVVAHAKHSEGNDSLLTNAAFDPIYLRPLAMDQTIACGLQAQAVRSKYDMTDVDSSRIAARAHGISLERAQTSVLKCDPLREKDLATLTDAACGILLVREDLAKKFTSEPVWLTGFGYATEEYALGDRDLTDPKALKSAAHLAYRMAGVQDPAREIELVEQTAYTSYQEGLWLEGLGLAERGEGHRWYLEHAVNPSGGGLRSHPGFATGLVRVCEAFERMRFGDAKRALAHGSYGLAGQAHAVLVLEA